MLLRFEFLSLPSKKSFLNKIFLILIPLLFLLGFLPKESLGTQPLLQDNSAPSSALIKLFDALKVPHDGTASGLNAVAQSTFLRKKGQERWQMEELYEDKRNILSPVLKELGVLEEIDPSFDVYTCADYIFIHGGLMERMRLRLNFLNTLWPKLSNHVKKHVRVVFLAGGRKLDREKESPKMLLDPKFSSVPFRPHWKVPKTLPSTEAQAARLACEQVITDPDLRKKVFFITAPTPKNQPRANTNDTITAWVRSFKNFQRNPHSVSSKERIFWTNAKNPAHAKILAISNNPYIPYQDQVFRNALVQNGFLKQGAQLETIGPRASTETPIAVHLDNIARWLYESVKTLSLEHNKTPKET